MPVPQTVLWKKLYTLKLECQNTRNLGQKRTLVYTLSPLSLTAEETDIQKDQYFGHMTNRDKVRNVAIILHCLLMGWLNTAGFPYTAVQLNTI